MTNEDQSALPFPDAMPKSTDERLASLEKFQENTNKRLETVQKLMEEIPEVLKTAFGEYDKTLRASLGQGQAAGGPNIITEVLGIVKGAVQGQQAQGTDEITGITRELVTLNLRGMLKDWQRRMGLVDHVTVTHG